MQMKPRNKKHASLLICLMLVLSLTFGAGGCAKTNNSDSSASAASTQTAQSEGGVLGEGNTKFMFTVVDKDGNETEFEIHTDKTTVGDALLELNLIDGEEGDYGLYVKTVNGITADYDTDQTYWAFYINDEYASTGVDTTDITENASYSFKVEK